MVNANKAILSILVDVLEQHPEGVKLRELGNSLGVNWRSLVEPVSSLLHKGKIEKVDGLYFLVRRRSSKRKTEPSLENK